MKASKFPVVLNSVALLLNITASTLYFLAGKPILGWIWAGCSAVWAFTVVTSVKTFRIQRRSADLLNRRRP